MISIKVESSNSILDKKKEVSLPVFDLVWDSMCGIVKRVESEKIIIMSSSKKICRLVVVQYQNKFVTDVMITRKVYRRTIRSPYNRKWWYKNGVYSLQIPPTPFIFV